MYFQESVVMNSTPMSLLVNTLSPPHSREKFTLLSVLILSGLVIVGASSTLIGWYGDITVLRQPFPALLPTTTATAWMLLFAAVALLGLYVSETQAPKITEETKAQARRIARGIAWAIIAFNIFVVGITLWVIVLGYDAVVAQNFIVINAIILPGQSDNLISLRSAMGLAFLGISFLFVPPQTPRQKWWFSFIALYSLSVALMPLLGYLYSASALYVSQERFPVGVPLPTALMLAMLAAGVLLLYKDDIDSIQLLFRPEKTAALTRQRLLITNGFALVLGWMALYVVEKNMVETATSIAFMVYALISGISWLMVYTGISAFRWEQEREETLRKLEQTERELRQTISTRDKLYSVVAHDLRSPFATISASAYLLRDDAERHPDRLSEDMLLCIQNIDTSSNQLSALLDNLLEWTRSQRGQVKVSPTTVNIATMVEGLKPLYELTFRKKGILFHTEVSEEINLTADRNMLHTTLRNLISNASKFTPSGGQISIGAKTDSNGTVIISVSDTGIGMSEEVRGKLFDNTGFTTFGTSGEKGTGLGLGLCKDFVERNGGQLWVESTVGKGSTFFIRLPSATSQLKNNTLYPKIGSKAIS